MESSHLVPCLTSLNTDLFYALLSYIPPESILALSSVCKQLYHAITRNQALWKQVCEHKWRWCNHQLVDSGNYKKLFTSGNGWECPKFNAAHIEPNADFISALQLLGQGTVVLATSNGLQVRSCHMSPCVEDGQGGSRVVSKASTLVAECAMEPSYAMVHALDVAGGAASEAGAATIVGGSSTGALMFWRLDAQERRLQHLRTSFHHQGLGRGSPVVDVQSLPHSSWIMGLHDATFSGLTAGRNRIRIYDMEADKSVSDIIDPFEQHELVCACSLGPGPGNELLLGSVHGSFCHRCYAAGVPSLCNHKAQSATASFSTVDLRASAQVSQRFSMHHRSLFPLMASARSTYVFTSHADQPLCVWDRRNMSCPLFEQERLRYFRAAYGPRPSHPACPSPAAHRPAAHALHSHWLGRDSLASQVTGVGQYLPASAGECGLDDSVPVASRAVPGGEHALLPGSIYPPPERHAPSSSGVHSQERAGRGGAPADEEGAAGVHGGGSGAAASGAGFKGAAEEADEEVEGDFRTFPLGSFCRRGSESQGLWLACNEDILLGRCDNGLIWRWTLARTLGWASPPASLRPSTSPQQGLQTYGGGAAAGLHGAGSFEYLYDGPDGSWNSAADELCHTSLWGGLAKYEHWPLPLGCYPCETSLPSLHLARGWDPSGFALLVANAVDGPEGVIVAQLH